MAAAVEERRCWLHRHLVGHERYTALFQRLHQVMVAHPGLVRLRLTRPFLSTGVVRLAERGLALLHEAGFT
ncbi:MAG: TetR/AcrR family transcriptional regulator C-terminal domain-containing protein, partial [Pseudonocardiaceae bacterium]